MLCSQPTAIMINATLPCDPEQIGCSEVSYVLSLNIVDGKYQSQFNSGVDFFGKVSRFYYMSENSRKSSRHWGHFFC